MESVAGDVWAWTVLCFLTLLFVLYRLFHKYLNLRAQQDWKGNGDRKARIILAQSGLRRSIIRATRLVIGLYLGTCVVWLQWRGETAPWQLFAQLPLVRGLVMMVALDLLNELLDVVDGWRYHRAGYREGEYQ